MTNFFWIISLLLFVTFDSKKNEPESNCKRVRRPWHLLDDEERDLYISGLLALRNKDGLIEDDDVAAIASVHGGGEQGVFSTYINSVHQSSSNNYWHSYLLYELESRIRNLGGRFSCFAMPYYDITLEHGREDDPYIFTTGLGGNGDPNNYYKVNDFSWDKNIKEYWVPNNCFADNEKVPFCSLKRNLRPLSIPSAQEYGELITKNNNFEDFARGYFDLDNFGGFFTKFPEDNDYHNDMGWEPIWPLYHSFVQYHQSIWTVCHEYDQIPSNELQFHSEAYSEFCDFDNYDGYLALGLDESLMYGGILPYKEWAYINKNDLTIRKLYDNTIWGIQYDLGNGEGFYTDSGLKEFCKNKLNEEWFLLNDIDIDYETKKQNLHIANIPSLTSRSSNNYKNQFLVVLGGAISIFILFLFNRIYNYQNTQRNKQNLQQKTISNGNAYGSV